MKIPLSAISFFLLLGASEVQPDPSPIPPLQYQATGFVPVLFIPPGEIRDSCGIEAPEGQFVVACTRWISEDARIVIMPDPCAVAEIDYYAAIQCHENAHFLSDWRHEP